MLEQISRKAPGQQKQDRPKKQMKVQNKKEKKKKKMTCRADKPRGRKLKSVEVCHSGKTAKTKTKGKGRSSGPMPKRKCQEEFLSNGQAISKYTLVSQRMRQLAGLLLQLRDSTNTPDANMESYLKPEHFDTVVKAVLAIAKYEEAGRNVTARISVPSLALKIGHSIRKCCNLVMNKAIRARDDELEREAQSFLRLLDAEWQYRVSSIALKTTKDDKRNKPDLIPLTSDLMKMTTYLQEMIDRGCKDLQAEPNTTNYNKLVDVTLSRMILFNKRRGGEASRMLIASYRDSGCTTKSGLDDIQGTLSQTEQQICSRMKLVEICGKRNMTVPVLLTPAMAKAIDCILSARDKIGIDAGNEFVFARTSGLNSTDACACMRRVAENAGVEKPELIHSTKLRKYVATVSQLLDMKQNELELLCNHMGHSVTVHREFYRLPSSTLELAKISKLLLAVETGKLTDLSGKKFDELDDIPDVVQEEDEENGSDVSVQENNEISSDEAEMYETEREDSDGTKASNSGVKRKTDSATSGRLKIKRKKIEVKNPKKSAKAVIKRPWTSTEKDAVFKFLSEYRTSKKELYLVRLHAYRLLRKAVEFWQVKAGCT